MEQFEYQRYGAFFAQVGPGLEELLEAELHELGITSTKQAYRGIQFKTDAAGLYTAVYKSRLASRILAPLLTFDCHSTRYLYETAREIPWEEILSPTQTFAIFAQVSNSAIKHSQFASQKTKDAIADRFRDRTGVRPSVDRNNPTIWINLHISNNRAVLALDAAGGPLHKRGYRKEGLEAPIQETLAAAIIRISEYDGSQPIFDPMCGSGTLLAEALMVGRRLPPATLRNRFGFQSFPDYDNSTWRRIRTAADDEAGPFPTGGISGGDKDKGAIYGARKNLDMIPGGKRVKLVQADLASHVLTEPTLIVTNPPYGLRLDPDKDLSPFYKRLGDWMKQNCAGSTAYIYFGDRKYLKSIGLRSKWKLPLRNGGLDGRLARFDLY